MQEFAIGRMGNCAGHLVNAFEIEGRNLLVHYGNDARRRGCPDMLAADSRIHPVHLRAGHELSLFHGRLHGFASVFDMCDDLSHLHARSLSHPENLEVPSQEPVFVDLRDHRAGLGRAEIDASDQNGVHLPIPPVTHSTGALLGIPNHDLTLEPEIQDDCCLIRVAQNAIFQNGQTVTQTTIREGRTESQE